jgi:NTE family protein
VEGPSGVSLITAASDTATESGAVGSYSSFQDTVDQWQRSLVDWRCKLSVADRRRFGAPAGWNCKDVKFFVGRIAFDQLDPQRAAALNAVETRFVLPPQQVDLLIDAGRDALRANGVFRSFLGSLGRAPYRSTPVSSRTPASAVSNVPAAAPAPPPAPPSEVVAQ